MGASSVILDGKLYTCSVDAVIVFDVPSLLAGQVDSTTISTPKVVNFGGCEFVSRHLVESCGRIHLVMLHRYGLGPIDYFEIYCLDVTTHEWLKVDSIGERAFFLSNMSCVSVCASDVGVECNCVYYLSLISGGEGRIYKICLDDLTMVYSLTPTDETACEDRFCWFVPSRRLKRMIMGSSVPPTNILNEIVDRNSEEGSEGHDASNPREMLVEDNGESAD